MKDYRLKFVSISGKGTINVAIIIPIILCQIFSTNGSIFSNVTYSESKMISKYFLLTNQECTTIIHQFDAIINDFEILEGTFSLPSNFSKLRLLRSLDRRSKCSISKDKLQNLKSEIEIVLANVSSSNNHGTCTYNLTDPDNCNELTKVLQCSIQHLKNGFVDAVTSNNGSIQEIFKWQNAYESLLDKYKKQSESLNQSLSQDYQLKFDKLQTDLQNLGKSLRIALDRLESTTISLCILEIKNGQIKDAVKHSKDLKQTSLSRIIKESYCVGNDTLCEKICGNIIQFMLEQYEIENKVTGFQCFYKEMESKKDFTDTKAFSLYAAIESSPAAKERLKDFLKNVDPIFMQTVHKVFERIVRGIGKALEEGLPRVVDRLAKEYL